MINHTYPNGDDSLAQNPIYQTRVRSTSQLQDITDTPRPQNLILALYRTAALGPRLVFFPRHHLHFLL